MTTTYYKRRNRKKPGIKVYIDGPFEVDYSLSKQEKADKLRKEVFECMVERSKNSNLEYIKYVEKGII